MKVSVWDTYVTKKDGSIMHFDIIAPSDVMDTNIIYGYGLDYLREKGQGKQTLNSKECKHCHVESVKPGWEGQIKEKGYFIYEMENCS